MRSLATRLDGRYGFPTGCADWHWHEWVAFVFNRTTLGLATLLGGWHLGHVPWERPLEGADSVGALINTHLGAAGLLFGVGVPLYLWVHAYVDAPGGR